MFEGTTDNFDPLRVKLIAVKGFDYQEGQIVSILKGCFSLLFVSAGKITISINNKENIYHAPTIICLSNRDKVSDVEMYKNTKLSIVYFDTVFLAKSLQMERLFQKDFADLSETHCFLQLIPFVEKDSDKKFFVLDNILCKHFRKTIEKMKSQLIVQPDFYWSCRTRSYLLELLMAIEKLLYDYVTPVQQKVRNISDGKAEFKKLVEYVTSHLDQNITLDELYKKFYINGQTIERLFSKFFKMTYKQYVKEQRFALAKHNLRFTDLTIKEIADKVGYSSTQSFSKFFKEMSGTSPVAFRNQQVNARKTDPRLKKQ